MKNQRGFIQVPILIAIIAGILVVGSAGYLVVKKVNKPAQVIPSEEVLKNSSEESTTTAVDADSTYLKEETARKKQRDADREKCIADVDRYDGSNCKASALACATLRANAKERENEEIDRCYFRFPNN